jgi:hypothetical protein
VANPYPAIFLDDNSETRLSGMVYFTDPANQPGAVFNGGTITEALVVAPTDPNATAITIQLPAGTGNSDGAQVSLVDENGVTIWQLFADAGIVAKASVWGGVFDLDLFAGRSFKVGAAGGTLKVDGAGTMGFYGHALAAQPVVPLTVPTVQNVIDALVAVGLLVQHD